MMEKTIFNKMFFREKKKKFLEKLVYIAAGHDA